MGASPPLQPLPGPAELERQVYGEPEAIAKLAYIDLETTGLDPSRAEIWELAIIVGEQELHWFLDVDLTKADPDALRISGYYDRHPSIVDEVAWLEHPESPAVAHKVAKVTAGAYLVGVNPAFDATFLGGFLRLNAQVPTWHYHLVDVLPLIAGRYKIPPPWDSKDLGRRIGIEPPTDDDRHTALGDARWAKAMYEQLMRRDEDTFATRPATDVPLEETG